MFWRWLKTVFFFILFHILDFYDFFLEIFYSTWDIKLYIEVTKNYDMVTIKKKFLISFFCHVLLIKNPKNIYIFSFYPRKANSRAHNNGEKNCDCISSSRWKKIIKWIKKKPQIRQDICPTLRKNRKQSRARKKQSHKRTHLKQFSSIS